MQSLLGPNESRVQGRGRWSAGVVALVLAFALAPQTALAADGVDGDFEFDIHGGEATITAYTGHSTDVVIPETLSDGNNNYTVTVIGDCAFTGEEVGDCDFSVANKLKSVEFPDTVKEIGGYAFQRNELAEVTLPDVLEKMGNDVFPGNNLTSIEIPDGIQEIRNAAFSNNELTEVSLPEELQTIAHSAFWNNSLTHVTLPAQVTDIDESAFKDSPGLESVLFLGDAPDVVPEDDFYQSFGSVSTVYFLPHANGFDSPVWEGYDSQQAHGFTDVESNGFAEEIAWLAGQDITEGYEGGTEFRPKNNITREAMAAFLFRLDGGDPTDIYPDPGFEDVDGFETEIAWLAHKGITDGYEDGTEFRPKNQITREAMAAFLFRYAEADGNAVYPNHGFNDVSSFASEIAWLVDQGITTGYNDGTEFRPKNQVTREAMAAFLFRTSGGWGG